MAFIVAAIRDAATCGVIPCCADRLWSRRGVLQRRRTGCGRKLWPGHPPWSSLTLGWWDIGVLHVVQVMRAHPSTAATPVLACAPVVRVREGLSGRAAADDLVHVIGPPLLPADLRAAVATALEAATRDATPLSPYPSPQL
jgi:hypothetical protein